MTTIERIERHQLVVVVRTDSPERASEAAEAAIRGGAKLVEITFSVPEAERVIEDLCAKHPDVLIGAGTVLSTAEAKKAIKAGAAYVVSPHLDEDIVRFVKKEGIVSIPGASTPTEIVRAHRAGGDIIKLFPFVEMGGLSFLKTIRGPLPFIRYMPSGGVTAENLAKYIAAQVTGIIVGSAIMRPELLKASDWDGIERLTRQFVEETNRLMNCQ